MSTDYKKVYDEVYTNSKIHQELMDTASNRKYKDPIIFDVVTKHAPKTLVDLGCGQGHYVRAFRKQLGIDAIGVEVSSHCCEKYLRDIPHHNLDIQSFFKIAPQFEFVFCTDVLEHIDSEDILNVIDGISKLSNKALLGIANHSDIQCGIELHLIRQPASWWVDILSRYYSRVSVLNPLYNGCFFFIECLK